MKTVIVFIKSFWKSFWLTIKMISERFPIMGIDYGFKFGADITIIAAIILKSWRMAILSVIIPVIFTRIALKIIGRDNYIEASKEIQAEVVNIVTSSEVK